MFSLVGVDRGLVIEYKEEEINGCFSFVNGEFDVFWKMYVLWPVDWSILDF